ncbi:MAG: sigma-54 dependent DNA-binding response regulator [Candidatus Ozemobacter sibiricus]|uniref:Sigma-54 dependent DNA-binding response regulator n=1 Tax=Candidatus Ozemobacter sibiricus TaxID=2268124 RepID=A0A367ZUA1_9BACT|nr:MAG: sigma-54 dependent DNA-binding response regulator [Candidatus Ozemobacter sibiricus]
MTDILLVDDEKLILWGLKKDLEKAGYRVTACASAEEALTRLEDGHFQAALLDVRLPGMGGLDLLERVKAANEDTQVIMMTAFADVEGAVSAIRRGAFDFVLKPFSLEKIHLTIQNALQAGRLQKEVVSLRTERAQLRPRAVVTGRSPRMVAVLEAIDRIGRAGAGVVLIHGESGTGKGLVANELHRLGPRAAAPFIEINCGAIPESLFESELFGHEKGAFTGATERKLGLMEVADGGTLFLDEVGEMPLTIQTKFLKALEEQKIWRVGGRRPVQIDVNIVAATNKDLAQAVQRGEFREDLFYRLNVVPIALPPLRERGEDILLLAAHFLEVSQARYRRSFKGLTEGAKHRLLTYDWPGNIRELRNCVERAVILETGPYITEASLGLAGEPAPARTSLPVPLPGVDSPEAPIPDSGFDLESLLNTIECGYLKKALQQCDGNQSQAARLLGMTRDNFRYRLKKYGLGEAVSEPVATGGPKG